MSKTPYEVRLDVLQLAKDMLDRETNIKQAAFLAQIDAMKTDKAYAVPQFVSTNMPSIYSTSDITQKFNELYSLVTDKTDRTSKENK